MRAGQPPVHIGALPGSIIEDIAPAPATDRKIWKASSADKFFPGG
jgi:hypothetical protein